MRKRHSSCWRRFWLVFPALTWLAVQFLMASGVQASSSSGILLELCSGDGSERVVIDLETGAPVEQSKPAKGCDWCRGFGNALDLPPRVGADWSDFAFDGAHPVIQSVSSHVVLRLVGNALTRAPPQT